MTQINYNLLIELKPSLELFDAILMMQIANKSKK